MPILQRFFGAEPLVADGALRAEAVRAAQGLDIEAAIKAHLDWKRQLRAQLQPHDAAAEAALAFEREPICHDDRCELGRWILGPGRLRLGAFPGFADLLAHHRMFHHVAANVLALRDAGMLADARRMLDDQFEDYSERVTQDLRLLQQVVVAPPEPLRG